MKIEAFLFVCIFLYGNWGFVEIMELIIENALKSLIEGMDISFFSQFCN